MQPFDVLATRLYNQREYTAQEISVTLNTRFTKGHDCVVLTYANERHLHKIEIPYQLLVEDKTEFIRQNVENVLILIW